MRKSIENIVKHSEYSEKAIERYLVDSVKNLGGICLKYYNPNMVGYPDRICLMPNGDVIWVELKSHGEQLRSIQNIRIKQLVKLKQVVHVCDNKQAIDKILAPYNSNQL